MRPLVVLSGNPRPGSRTADLADRLAAALAVRSGRSRGASIDLSAFGGRVLDAADVEVAALRDEVAGAGLLVVATPVYKGAYTGLLKAFLDGFGPAALDGVETVPVVVGASEEQTVVAAAHLAALLDELGAEHPGGVLTVVDRLVATDPDAAVAGWMRHVAVVPA